MHEVHELRRSMTPEEMRLLIRVPPDVEEDLLAFCEAHPGPEAEEFREVLDMRSAMLDYLKIVEARERYVAAA
jgi:hypothetical protein